MSDYIRREDAISELNVEGYTKNTRLHKRILAIPAADVEPVVYCRDCVYDDKCFAQSILNDKFFCADGKRREGDADE